MCVGMICLIAAPNETNRGWYSDSLRRSPYSTLSASPNSKSPEVNRRLRAGKRVSASRMAELFGLVRLLRILRRMDEQATGGVGADGLHQYYHTDES